MKIGVLGNSHIAAFKLGWEQIKNEYPGVDLVFFGSPTTSMRFFRVEDECLIPTREVLLENLLWTSGGFDRIPGDMDAYILVGLGFSFIHLLDLLKVHRPPSVYNNTDATQQLVSENFFYSAMEGTLRNSNAMQLIIKLRQISEAPIACAPNPYGTIDLLTSERHSHFQIDSIRNRIFDFYLASMNETLAGPGLHFFEQPEQTIVDRMFTARTFSKGSIKLEKGMASQHNSDDFFHMNAKFGAASLRDVLNHLLGTDRTDLRA